MTCIESTYYKAPNGYVRKWHNGKLHLHHRLAYEQEHGPIPKGQVVMHTCDNRACINPQHLRLGTQQDNITDAVNKARHCHGTTHGANKLTEAEVLEIRASTATQRNLAIEYGISKGTICQIKTRRIWRHI